MCCNVESLPNLAQPKYIIAPQVASIIQVKLQGTIALDAKVSADLTGIVSSRAVEEWNSNMLD